MVWDEWYRNNKNSVGSALLEESVGGIWDFYDGPGSGFGAVENFADEVGTGFYNGFPCNFKARAEVGD